MNANTEKETGWSVLKEIEEHCGKQVAGRRLRFLIAGKLDRLLKEKRETAESIRLVLDGQRAFDPKTHRPHKIPRSL